MWKFVQAKPKASRRRKRFVAFVVAVLVVVILALGVYRRAMVPTILEIALAKVQSEATRAINEAVSNVLADAVYTEFITVERNSNDDIVMLSANSAVVNAVARKASLEAQQKICGLFTESLQVHWGTLSGVPMLNEQGPTVAIKISPIGSVQCSFYSKFESAGINQTLHRIFLNVESRVDLIVPTAHEELKISTPILICETVIVGKIPETFLQSELVLGGN